MNKLTINKELQDLLQPLTTGEYSLLEQSIIKDGCRDPLIVWDNILIDGHNRYEICNKNNIRFTTKNIDFKDIEEAKDWIDRNQAGRRNMTPDFNNLVIGRIYNRTKLTKSEAGSKKGKATDKMSTAQQRDPKGKFYPSGNVAKQIAEEHGLSEKTVKNYGKFALEVENDPELEKAVRTGRKAVKDIKKAKKQKQLEIKKKEILVNSKNQLVLKPTITKMDCVDFLNIYSDNTIDCIITDPPYSTDVKDINQFVNYWLPTALKKVKSTGRMYICTGAYPIEIQAYLNVLLKQNKFVVDNPLIWTYRNTLGVTPKMKYNLNYQMIWHLYSEKSNPLDTSITNEMFSVQYINAPDGRLGNRFHTWQKPDELARRFVYHSTKSGDKIIDPFACTGTFLLEASKANRISNGCDINKDNIKIAIERGCVYVN